MMAARQQFSSSLTTILTMIGVSVGLGNVWRFPYMMGLYGGSAFLIIYLLFTFFLSVPAVTAEWALGRLTRSGPIGAFSKAFNPTIGHIIGLALIVTVTVADSYYIVVISNVITTAYYSIFIGFNESSIIQFNHTLSIGWLQYSISLSILMLSVYIIYLGLNRGIEWISKFIVPFFLVLMVYLIIHALLLEGSWEYFVTFLKPDFSKLTSEIVFAAMGQAFFSLGLGGTFLLIYGSYMKDDENLVKGAIFTGLGDVGAAVLAGIFIVPTILAFNLDLASGPGLLFNTLPQLFGSMPFGRIMGSLFLLGLILVAFLSNIAALEVVAGSLNDSPYFKICRNQTIILLGIVEVMLILPSSLYPPIIGTLDLIFGSGMQTLGSGLTILAVCWGYGNAQTIAQVLPHSKSHLWQKVFIFWLKWVIPGTLLIVLVLYLLDNL